MPFLNTNVGENFTEPDRVTSSGTWKPQYSYGYGSRWVSGWSFSPNKGGGGGRKAAPPKNSSTVVKEAIKTPKPKAVLGASQTVAEAGDTVPIIFGKRVGTVGGIWVQPTLVKVQSRLFTPVNVFAVSQGYLVSSPVLANIWAGDRNMKYDQSLDATPVYHSYVSESYYETNQNYNLFGNIVFPDFDVYSFAGNTLTTNGGTVRRPDIANNYYANYELTKGTGDTNNSVIRYNNSDILVYDTKTGNDVTAAYWSYLGINPVGTYSYINAVYSGSTIIGGRDTSTVVAVTGSISAYASPTGAVPYSTGPVTFSYGTGTLLDQINPALPVDTGTLYGVTQEWSICPYADPNSPPANKNFTNYADITFLIVWARLWDPNEGTYFDPANESEWPEATNFKQLSIFYEQGVSVFKYSDGSYTYGASNQFVDLAVYLFELIDPSGYYFRLNSGNFEDIGTFCTNTGLFFNGAIDQASNAVDYVSSIAAYFLLAFINNNDDTYNFSIKPILPLTAGLQIDTTALTPVITFDEDSILPGSYEKKYFSSTDQRPVVVNLQWREADPAIVGIQRTTSIRYPTTASNAPVVQFDMTDFCTTAAHAEIYGKYELARRRYSTHAIRFSSFLTNLLGPTDIIKLERQRINSAGDNRTEIEWYQVTGVKINIDGSTQIEAAHFPVNSSDVAIISNEIVNGTFTVT